MNHSPDSYSQGFQCTHRWHVTALALMISFLTACQSGPGVRSGHGKPGETPEVNEHNENESAVPMTYTSEPFKRLVAKYSVDNGQRVDYAAWKDTEADLQALNKQVELLANISPETHPDQFPTRSDQRSYWINTYNTLVLHAVLEYWPLESVKDVKISLSSRIVPGKGFFYDRPVIVGSESTNLYDLEKKVLKQQKDPRLHFALNCASGSCPVLRPWEWTDEQLDQAAREFINNPANVSVGENKVHVSKIFKWYKKDFPTDLLAYLGQYAESPLSEKLTQASHGKFSLSYTDYDWSLNDEEPAAAESADD